MLLPKNDPTFNSVARLATERRRISALECTTRIVFNAIFPVMNASPAKNTANIATVKPGLVETIRKLHKPTTMLVPSATRGDVRSVYQPAIGAQIDCAKTY